MRRILVTGGAGFIGSHLCEKLLIKGYKILCLDNLVTGSMNNIKSLSNRFPYTFEFLNADLMLDLNFKDNINEIYHLASPTAPADVKKNEITTLFVNSSVTESLLKYSDEHNCKFLFVSSVKVLGDCTRVESYIHGKRTGEFLCRRERKTKSKVARLGSVYGPNMATTDSRVIPVFIQKCLKGEEISLWNGGTQQDSFCYVDDIVDGLIGFMESDYSGLIEFGNPEAISIMDLAKIILRYTGDKSSIKTTENVLVVDECHKVPDISKAIELLKWKPNISLHSGLLRTINYFSERINNVA